MDRTQKKELIGWMNEAFSGAGVLVITHYKGLTVKEVSDLRGRMRAAGAGFRVTKNRLTKLALKGTQYESLSETFSGPTAVGYSEDPVAAAKMIVEFAKDNEKLVVLGGAIGAKVLDADSVKALAKLPSLDELRATIVGLLNAPATRIAGVLQAPGGQVARVIGAYANQG